MRGIKILSRQRERPVPAVPLFSYQKQKWRSPPMLDFSAIKNGSASFADLAAKLTKADLYKLTDEMIDTMQAIVADAIDADVIFVPRDPNADDPFGKPEEKEL